MGPGQTTTEPRQNLFEIGKEFREFRFLVFGPIPQIPAYVPWLERPEKTATEYQ